MDKYFQVVDNHVTNKDKDYFSLDGEWSDEKRDHKTMYKSHVRSNLFAQMFLEEKSKQYHRELTTLDIIFEDNISHLHAMMISLSP